MADSGAWTGEHAASAGKPRAVVRDASDPWHCCFSDVEQP